MEYIPVRMIREDLAALPEYGPPDGYSMRPFRSGDRATWLSIWRASERFEKVLDGHFDAEFGRDLPGMARRCLFLVSPGGRDVGTITAWYERRYRARPWGRIHYVAIVPRHRGKGLSRCLLTAAMKRLRALGHRRATLVTQTPRIAAIRTYLRFGFVPDRTAPDAARAWAVIGRQIDHPALKNP